MISFSPIEFHKNKFKNITPSLRYNGQADIKKHQDVCINKLGELLGLDKMEKCPSDFHIISKEELDYGIHTHFAVQTEEGYYAHCHLLMPHSFEGKLPLCVCLQGHVSGAHLSMGIVKDPYDEVYLKEDNVDFCVQAVKHGYIGLAIEQRGFGENAGNDKLIGTNCSHTAFSAILMGRTIIGERVWDVMRVLDCVLEIYGDILTMEQSILMGMSGGGTATYYAACFEKRFDVYLPGASLCSFKDSIIELCHCSCNYVPKIAEYFDMSDLAILIAPKKLIIQSATEDKYFPLKGAISEYSRIKDIYTMLNASENCMQIIGEGPHSFYPDSAWKTIEQMLK